MRSLERAGNRCEMIDLKSRNRTHANEAINATVKAGTEDQDLRHALPQTFGDHIVNKVRPSDRRCPRTGRAAVLVPGDRCSPIGDSDNVTALRSEDSRK